MNPKFGRRSWVKLWVTEWLEGTTRFEMNDCQRAFWIDLLALAGRSRFPGKICAGEVEGKLIGYPLTKFQSLMAEPIDILKTLQLFESTGKLHLSVTTEEPVRLYLIELINWERYQSEYHRQKKYRAKKNGKLINGDKSGYTEVTPESYTSGYTQGNKTEGEERRENREVEEKHIAHASQLGSPEFKLFISEYPTQTGRKDALHAWCKQRLDFISGDVMASLAKWKKSIRWQDPQFIPYPAKWLSDQWKTEPVNGVSKHEQKRQSTKAAIERVRAKMG